MARLAVAACLTALTVAGVCRVAVQAGAPASRPDGLPLERVMASYLAGDTDIISREFKTSLELQNRLKLGAPKDFDRWLGAYEPGKAVFVLALARTASDIGPQYTAVLLQGGGRYVDGQGRGPVGSAATAEFARQWHRVAVGLLQGQHHAPAIERHLAAIDPKTRADVAADPRLILARAIAQELHCWSTRPADQPSVRVTVLGKDAGVLLKQDLDGPTRARREALVSEHYLCLTEGIARFDAARAAPETRAEAGVRGGWLLVQQAQFQDAIAWLDAAAPASDAALAYWRNIFRGRALSGLGRHRDASAAYREAFTRFPGSQTAGLGLAFELLLLDEAEEADQVARSLRATAATAVDPWTTYLEADWRFVDAGIEAMRKQALR